MVPITVKPRRAHLPERQVDPLWQTQPDDEALQPGDPGYRTQVDHSSLDILESNAEIAHMTGVFLRNVVTGRLRTSNPVYLLLLALLGLAVMIPMLLAFLALGTGTQVGMLAWLVCILLFLFGAALLDEVIAST